MPGIVDIANSYNAPNFVGELFAITPEDTPFTTAIGGLSGGKQADAKQIEWQGYDLRAAADDRQAIEGDDAPTPEERKRFNFGNVVEVHHEAVGVSYTKLAAVGQRSGANIDGTNPVQQEMTFQVEAELKQIKRDLEKSFITGTYHNPGDNSTARRTRGLLQAIETLPTDLSDDGATANVIAVDGPLTSDRVLDLLQMIFENGGIQETATAAIIVNAFQKRVLSEVFIRDSGFRQTDRNVGGVNLETLETEFGTLNVMLNRHMPKAQLAVVSLEQCAPVLLEIPDKGFLFVEELAKTGATDRAQIYGEVGLEYGNPLSHGKLTGLTFENPGS